MQIRELTNERLERIVPAAFATEPFAGVSTKYDFVPTIKAVDYMRDAGWLPTAAHQSRTRIAEKQGYQKHVIRFAHPLATFGKGERLEIALYNSHDTGCAFQLAASVYRLVCGNGMLHSSDLFNFSHKHIGFDPQAFVTSAQTILAGADEIAQQVDGMRAIELSPDERGIFAAAAHSLVYDDTEKAPIRPDQLLHERRYDDKGKDLWSTFNVTQENILKGGLRGITRDAQGRAKRTKTRPVNSIDRDKKLNKALWTLTEAMAALKNA